MSLLEPEAESVFTSSLTTWTGEFFQSHITMSVVDLSKEYLR